MQQNATIGIAVADGSTADLTTALSRATGWGSMCLRVRAPFSGRYYQSAEHGQWRRGQWSINLENPWGTGTSDRQRRLWRWGGEPQAPPFGSTAAPPARTPPTKMKLGIALLSPPIQINHFRPFFFWAGPPPSLYPLQNYLLANSYATNANAAKGAARRFGGRGPVNHATTRTRLMAVAIRMCWRGVFAKPL